MNVVLLGLSLHEYSYPLKNLEDVDENKSLT